ncbi:hypothetical protein D915_000933 [Fasciola hepatica]|uniref:PDZ domain-containing protein n=1 Tax=Fasciola hepatica TaxID=6192 RepID=A0A4E0RLE5_FASHE|nr:hypothetical protein D915_000933 [Fasciola hepatica]
MPYAIGTSYSFISNNLRCGTVDSVLIPTIQQDRLSPAKVTVPLKAVQGAPKPRTASIDPSTEWDSKINACGPAERRLRAVSTVHRMRNSLSSEATKLEFSPMSVSKELYTDHFGSRDSSPSSSSSVPLSPASSANVPLLHKGRSKSAQRLVNTRSVLKADLKMERKKRKHILLSKSGSNFDNLSCPIATKFAVSPTNSLSYTARRVWNALERKLIQNCNQNLRITQSRSISRLSETDEHRKLDSFELCAKKQEGMNSRPMEKFVRDCPNLTDTEEFSQSDRCDRLNTDPGLHVHNCISRVLPHSLSLNFPRDKSSDFNEHIKPFLVNHKQQISTPTDQCKFSESIDCKKCFKVQNHEGIQGLTSISCQKTSYFGNRVAVNGQFKGPNAGPERCTLAANRFVCKEHGSGFHVPHCESQELCHHYRIPEIRETILIRPEGMHRFGMRIESIGGGVYLTTVLKNSPASAAGLKVGDELIQLNGFQLTSLSTPTIMELVRSTPQALHVTYRPRMLLARCHEIQIKKLDGRVGIRLKRLPEGMFVDVVLPFSAASQAGIKEGDELLMVNGQPVSSWSQDGVSQMLREIPSDQIVRLYIKQLVPLRDLITNPKKILCWGPRKIHKKNTAATYDDVTNLQTVDEPNVHEYEQLLSVLRGEKCCSCERNFSIPQEWEAHFVLQKNRKQPDKTLACYGVQKPAVDPLQDKKESGEPSYSHDEDDRGDTSICGNPHTSPYRMINSLSDWAIAQRKNTNIGDI